MRHVHLIKFILAFSAFSTTPLFLVVPNGDAQQRSRGLVKELEGVMGSIKKVEDKLDSVERSGQNLNDKINQHNGGQCVENNPGECKWYDDEAESLREEQQALNNEDDQLKQQLNQLESRKAVLLGNIRIAPFLHNAEEFRRRVVACSQLPPERAAGCLNAVYSELD